MSSDKYAQHLIQKYKLAVAVAVIQTVPESKSLDQHLIDLRNKFNEKMDDDITICSDDFDVDFNDFNDEASQNSGTVLKDFNDAKIPGKNKDVFPDNMDIVQNIGVEERQHQNNNDDIQSTFCETQTQLDISLAPDSLTDIDKTFCDSIARIHRENIMDIDRTCDNIAKIYKTQANTDRTTCRSADLANNNDRSVEVNTVEKITKADVNNIQKSNEITNIKDPVSLRHYLEGSTAFDSQATELYTVQCQTENYTHVSQSQNHYFDVSDKYIKGINNKSIQETNENVNDTSIHMSTDFNHLKDVYLVRKIKENLENESRKNNMDHKSHNFDQNTQTAIDYREINEQLKQTQGPSMATVYDSENLLPKNFKDDNLARKICKNLEQDKAAKYVEKNDAHKSQINETRKERINDDNLQEKQVYYILSNNAENYPQHHFNVDKCQNTDQFATQTNNTTPLNELSINNTENMTMQVFDLSQNQTEPINDLNKISIDDDANESEDEDMSQPELVPFKVMEELNRVKGYLNKGMERRMSNESSLDSGYRSDSLGRSSQGRRRSGYQLSGNWVGQSGYCLFDHLTRCPLVAATEEIVVEISEVLGELIDRLHEHESYPAFLEELLSHVESLIRCIFAEDDLVLDKDEKIQRLFLLNKSIHIQKYSIEKLTDILEDIHTRLTAKEELYELTNIQEIENLSYIFHILEVILKRCLKNKKVDNSQSQSQETVYQKKSSISDIWRKKWNPNYKEDLKIDSSLEKKCVLKRCNEILNKIVVGCMDGYSLVAFAALQCFNMLQS